MHVEQITTWNDLASLEQKWNALAGELPFRSWDWLATWWKHYGNGSRAEADARDSDQQLYVLAVFADSNESTDTRSRLIGVAPWYLDRTRIKGNVLRWLGSGEVCTDHLSFICRPEDTEAVTNALAETLTAKFDDWDSIDLGAVDSGDATIEALLAHLEERDCLVSRHAADSCWVVELPATWDEYLAGISKSHRKQLRQLERRVLESDRVCWHQARSTTELADAWPVLVDLHQRRRRSLGEPGCFASRVFHDFHHEVAERLLGRNQLRISWMELDGSPAAAEYHFADSTATYAYQGGVDPDRLADEPGRLSTILCLRAAIEEGHKQMDFLRGDEPYKAHWRATPQTTYDYRVIPNRRLARLRGRVWNVADTIGDWAQRRWKSAGLRVCDMWKEALLNSYYWATLPSRQRAAVQRAKHECEPVQILFYHRIADAHPNGWTMPTQSFARQIDWLHARFDIVSLSEAQTRIASGCNQRPTVCITFDDGYADNRRSAIPMLLNYQIPFTYFVSTNHVLGGESFPHDVEAGQPLEVNTLAHLRELAAAGVEIGADTRSHANLGADLTHDDLEHEIVGSKKAIEAAIGHEVRYFAFPYGKHENLSAAAFRIAHEAGFAGVCSAYGGYNFPSNDAFHLRRFHADCEFVRFKNWLTIDPRKLRMQHDFDPGDFRSANGHESRESAETVVASQVTAQPGFQAYPAPALLR